MQQIETKMKNFISFLQEYPPDLKDDLTKDAKDLSQINRSIVNKRTSSYILQSIYNFIEKLGNILFGVPTTKDIERDYNIISTAVDSVVKLISSSQRGEGKDQLLRKLSILKQQLYRSIATLKMSFSLSNNPEDLTKLLQKYYILQSGVDEQIVKLLSNDNTPKDLMPYIKYYIATSGVKTTLSIFKASSRSCLEERPIIGLPSAFKLHPRLISS
jgi:uncharacterized protein YaaR (DUF327 family)